LLRLGAVQGAWSYERMLGIGMGYAALPLLEDLRTRDPARYREAVARHSEFFNAQPFLASLSLGATTRAEYDGVAGDKITRLRTALCGPLGALGDQLFWTGLLPALAGFAILAVGLGRPVIGLVTFVVVFNAVRLAVGWWGLELGWHSGMRVGIAMARSWMARAVTPVGLAASLAIGMALPVAAAWLLSESSPGEALGVAVVVGAGVAAGRISPRITGFRLTLGLAALTFLWYWVSS